MRKIIPIILVLTIFVFGCSNIDIKTKINKTYIQSKNFFPKEYTTHFPKSISDSSGFETNALTTVRLAKYCFGIKKLFYSRTYSKAEYNEVSKPFRLSHKARYSAKDTSFIILSSYRNSALIEGELYDNLASPKEKQLAKHNLMNAKGLPVPLFTEENHFGETLCRLSPNFELYVLDAEPGKYLEDKYLYDSSECLPEKWKHGISRGVACSDKDRTIIYWIVVW